MSRAARRITPPYLDSVRRRRQAELLLEFVPATARGYVEPLLDGGALAVALLARHPEWSFVLGSGNRDLVCVWATVRAQAEHLVERVAFHAARHSAAYFAAEREFAGETPDPGERPEGEAAVDVDRAARFIYLRGTAAPGSGDLPRQDFADAVLGRDVLAFDAAGVLELAAVLRDRDVEFLVGAPFAFLPAVWEDDLVLLEAPASADTLKALRSFAGAVTAKGAALVLHPGSVAPAEGFAAWRDLKRVDATESGPGGEGVAGTREPESAVWGNRVLQRLRQASAGH